MNRLGSLFAIPYYHSSINPDSYDRFSIVHSITNNYNIDNQRNHWDSNNLIASNLHHSYNDHDNHRFSHIDFSQLMPIYNQSILDFLNQILVKPVQYQFSIVNYTCMGCGQFMSAHNHPGADFSAVHYIKFNPLLHRPTVYINPATWSAYTDNIFNPPLISALDLPHWTQADCEITVKENDFVITPGCLSHCVPINKHNELRITVVLNIKILDGSD